jgi:hypothetical protein
MCEAGWIVNTADDLGNRMVETIALATHEGDNVEHGDNTAEWAGADGAHSPFPSTAS